MASGDTKTEAMLNVLGNGGTGDEFRGCCNTKTQQYILDAIDRINKLDPGGGGTSDFNELDNRPMYNGEPMTGETDIPQINVLNSVESFSTTDALSANVGRELYDMISSIPVGGSINTLFLSRGAGNTEYPIEGGSEEEQKLCKIINDYLLGDNKNFLIVFEKDSTGVPRASFSISNIIESENYVHIWFNLVNTSVKDSYNNYYGVNYKPFGFSRLQVYVRRDEYDAMDVQEVFANYSLTSKNFLLASPPDNQLWGILENSLSNTPLGTANTTAYTPTQNYHPATKKYVDDKILTGAGAPTTATVGVVGQLYEDSTNGKLYQCTAVSSGTYTWTEIGAGGGGVNVVQTTGTSTTDVMSQDATTKMVYAPLALNQSTIKIGSGNIDNYAFGSISIGAQYMNVGEAIAIGSGSSVQSGASGSISIGNSSQVNSSLIGSIALGYQARPSRSGELNISSQNTSYGYNNTNYRIIGGVHDGQLANDAVTVSQVNTVIDAINTALSASIPHIGV